MIVTENIMLDFSRDDKIQGYGNGAHNPKSYYSYSPDENQSRYFIKKVEVNNKEMSSVILKN